MIEAFYSLCEQLCSSVCLIVPCTSDIFVLECDASACGVGAVLSVERGKDQYPVTFFSRQLKGAQSRYSAQELEGLALFEEVRHFAFYLYGNRFTVVTDHRGLVTLMSARQENRTLYNWVFRLTEFDFEISRENGLADCLSRCYDKKVQMCAVDGHSASQKEGGDVDIPT